MAIELVEVSKNTRGINSREIKYRAIGKWVEKTVARESKPEFNADGTPKLDDKGNQIRTPLGKDAEGRLITIDEKVSEFETDGVITDIGDAMDLINAEWQPKDDKEAEQLLLDCFAEGFNARQYSREADKDELDEFLSKMEMNDEQRSAFKRAARQLSKTIGMTVLEGAEQIVSMIEAKKAKALATA